MKRQHSSKNGKPVTFRQLQTVIAPLYKRFDGVDKRLDGVDKRLDGVDKQFVVVHAKLGAFIGINTMNIDRAVRDAKEDLEKQLRDIKGAMDAFLKRSEENEREILFLGQQHDDLAQFCTKTIHYPPYGTGKSR